MTRMDEVSRPPSGRRCTLEQVPPYSFLRPGKPPEEAATAAAKEMRMSHPCDALTLLWELKRAAGQCSMGDFK